MMKDFASHHWTCPHFPQFALLILTWFVSLLWSFWSSCGLAAIRWSHLIKEVTQCHAADGQLLLSVFSVMQEGKKNKFLPSRTQQKAVQHKHGGKCGNAEIAVSIWPHWSRIHDWFTDRDNTPRGVAQPQLFAKVQEERRLLFFLFFFCGGWGALHFELTSRFLSKCLPPFSALLALSYCKTKSVFTT